MLTKTIPRLQVTVVIAISVLFNVPRFFEHNVISTSNVTTSNVTTTRSMILGDSIFYQVIYSNILYYPVMYIIPLTSLSYLNWRLIRAMRKMRLKKRSMTGGRRAPRDDGRSAGHAPGKQKNHISF